MKKGLYVLVGLGIMQIIAQEIGLYWIYPNFDIPMHFLGGVWLGFLSTWLLFRLRIVKRLHSGWYLFGLGVVSLLVGLGWEVFEYLMDQWIDTNMQPSLMDTKLDLVMDLLGAYIVGLWILTKHE